MRKTTLLASLTLLVSMGTLLCCAVPALLVMLGLGAIVAGMVSSVPGIVSLSEYKAALFMLSITLLVVATVLMRRGRTTACATLEPQQAAACAEVTSLARAFLLVAWLLFIVGISSAYLAPLFLGDI